VGHATTRSGRSLRGAPARLPVYRSGRLPVRLCVAGGAALHLRRACASPRTSMQWSRTASPCSTISSSHTEMRTDERDCFTSIGSTTRPSRFCTSRRMMTRYRLRSTASMLGRLEMSLMMSAPGDRRWSLRAIDARQRSVPGTHLLSWLVELRVEPSAAPVLRRCHLGRLRRDCLRRCGPRSPRYLRLPEACAARAASTTSLPPWMSAARACRLSASASHGCAIPLSRPFLDVGAQLLQPQRSDLILLFHATADRERSVDSSRSSRDQESIELR
jgi:hypothetical protein